MILQVIYMAVVLIVDPTESNPRESVNEILFSTAFPLISISFIFAVRRLLFLHLSILENSRL